MGSSPRRRALAAIVLTTSAAARPARAVDLATLLRAVERTATFAVPATADLRIETPGTPTATNALRLAGRDHVVRLEAAGEWRALVKASKIVVAAMGRTPRESPEATLPGSALLVADFAPFTAPMLRVPLISDEGPLGVVVTGEPRPPSPYVLLVYTIDSKRSVVSGAKYYRWEINNLVQMTRVREWEMVGTSPRPKVVDVQEIASGKTSTLSFVWRLRPDLAPALFRPSGLGIPLPAPAPTGP
jgi:hypothetical protein